ncbi:protein PTST, chloroplastic-like [Rosa chinensis]|uniref:protein PTST, chloroplastic-like n=1 Tax=Rosa chinensis TaxID=74649 RepID=UPI001AD8B5B8|nr:protein PTST, chloroplastic-like [Rosa chinensis]
MDIGSTRCCLDKQVLWLSSKISRKLDWNNIHLPPYTVNTWKLKSGFERLINSQVFNGEHSLNHVLWRRYSIPTSLEESSSVPAEAYGSNDELKDSVQEHLAQPLRSIELHIREDALINFKSELAVMELELLALVKLAEENAKSVIPVGSGKINGKYIQSHLLSRLEAVHEKLKEQIKDVDAAQSKEVSLFWCGMAESVQVMGTFDGWSQGEHLSAEYAGSFSTFSTTLMLRPGRYEIKFLVDGE